MLISAHSGKWKLAFVKFVFTRAWLESVVLLCLSPYTPLCLYKTRVFYFNCDRRCWNAIRNSFVGIRSTWPDLLLKSRSIYRRFISRQQPISVPWATIWSTLSTRPSQMSIRTTSFLINDLRIVVSVFTRPTTEIRNPLALPRPPMFLSFCRFFSAKL